MIFRFQHEPRKRWESCLDFFVFLESCEKWKALRVLADVWLISIDCRDARATVDELTKEFRKMLPDSDLFFIDTLSFPLNGWMPESVWKWIDAEMADPKTGECRFRGTDAPCAASAEGAVNNWNGGRQAAARKGDICG